MRDIGGGWYCVMSVVALDVLFWWLLILCDVGGDCYCGMSVATGRGLRWWWLIMCDAVAVDSI